MCIQLNILSIYVYITLFPNITHKHIRLIWLPLSRTCHRSLSHTTCFLCPSVFGGGERVGRVAGSMGGNDGGGSSTVIDFLSFAFRFGICVGPLTFWLFSLRCLTGAMQADFGASVLKNV